ncbi:MAG: winged helix-turn-helix domain-containing protein [Phycisphaerales bacterium]|nr:winged helix-turn-helix domain-containing protein [Phycisphaerales bacterium]
MLRYNLEQAGFDAEVAFDGRSGLAAIVKDRPDVVLLDWMIPQLPGTEVARRVRIDPATAAVPIIMLTARGDEVDQVVGLTVGADDYVTKPFSMKVLLARIEAVIRRRTGSQAGSATLAMGQVCVNTETHQVLVDGAPTHTTLTEFRLLAALIQAEGRILTRAQLMTRALGPGITATERTIDVHMTAIRKKLGPAGGVIHTVRGVGYRAAAEPATES